MQNTEQENVVSGPGVEHQQTVDPGLRPEDIQVTNIGAEISPDLARQFESQTVAGPAVQTRHDIGATLGSGETTKPKIETKSAAPESQEKITEMPEAKSLLGTLKDLQKRLGEAQKEKNEGGEAAIRKEFQELQEKLKNRTSRRVNGEVEYVRIKLGYDKQKGWSATTETWDKNGKQKEKELPYDIENAKIRDWHKTEPNHDKLPQEKGKEKSIAYITFKGQKVRATCTLLESGDYRIDYEDEKGVPFSALVPPHELRKYENNGKVCFTKSIGRRPKLAESSPTPPSQAMQPETADPVAPGKRGNTDTVAEAEETVKGAREESPKNVAAAPATATEDPDKVLEKGLENAGFTPEQIEKVKKLIEKRDAQKGTAPAPAAAPVASSEAATPPTSRPWYKQWGSGIARAWKWCTGTETKKALTIAGGGSVAAGTILGLAGINPLVGMAVLGGYSLHKGIKLLREWWKHRRQGAEEEKQQPQAAVPPAAPKAAAKPGETPTVQDTVPKSAAAAPPAQPVDWAAVTGTESATVSKAAEPARGKKREAAEAKDAQDAKAAAAENAREAAAAKKKTGEDDFNQKIEAGLAGSQERGVVDERFAVTGFSETPQQVKQRKTQLEAARKKKEEEARHRKAKEDENAATDAIVNPMVEGGLPERKNKHDRSPGVDFTAVQEKKEAAAAAKMAAEQEAERKKLEQQKGEERLKALDITDQLNDRKALEDYKEPVRFRDGDNVFYGTIVRNKGDKKILVQEVDADKIIHLVGACIIDEKTGVFKQAVEGTHRIVLPKKK